MHKRVLVVGGVVAVSLVASVGSWILIQRGASGEILVDQLSPRAQEFITADTSQGSGLWTEVTLEEGIDETTPAGTRIQTQCFAITPQQRTLNHKIEENEAGCVFRARSLEPAGTLVVSSQLVENLKENTGYTLRKDNPDLYTEYTREFSMWPISAVFSDAESIVAFGWRDGVLYTVALSGLASITPEKVEVVMQLLERVEVLP